MNGSINGADDPCGRAWNASASPQGLSRDEFWQQALRALERRPAGLFATLVDLDGSYVQIIEFNRDHEH
jgi:hypothetical protein